MGRRQDALIQLAALEQPEQCHAMGVGPTLACRKEPPPSLNDGQQ